MKEPRYTEQQIAQALRQAEQGTPAAEVCRKLGVSGTTFYLGKKRNRRAPHPTRPVLRPAAGRRPLDPAPVCTDHPAHRATRMAPDLIERKRHGGGRRGWVDPGRGVSGSGRARVARLRAREVSRAGIPRKPSVIYFVPAEWQVGERAARYSSIEGRKEWFISGIPA